MAIPTPRSYNQILADMLDAFMARFGIDRVKPGSPILSILEAAAQSDLRSTQDIFSYLNSINLDRARGDAVDRIGADEDLPRFNETFGTGVVTVGDSSFDKISTKIYVGTPAPIVGTTGANFFVADASEFPNSGSIYIGRGTTNYEGPIAYSAKTAVGTYWSLTLSSATQKFHNLQEPVVLAQGGNRLVSAGTIVRTAQGNANQAVEFSTLYSVTVPDGEVSVTGVQVVAKEAGIIGRINAEAIVEFSSDPFTGATVTNPLPFSNAKAVENETDYKERIRNARRTRAKGTPLAITSGVLGVLAPDENKTVLSASFIRRQGFPGTLYIDDGTGYEERSTGVSIEGIVDSASGGERFFEVNSRPVAKAFLETTITEPFTLESGSKLAIKVNGLQYTHTFSADEFRNIANASAYEVVASINGNPTVPFNARLSGNGDLVAIIADLDTGENLEVVEPAAVDIDANQWLGFTVGVVDTMLLYKNDRLLSKDGRTAIVTSNPQVLWAVALVTPATLELAIDNTPATTYSFTSQDFIDSFTGYATMASSNSLDAWVTVFNARIPGITAVKSGSTIIFTSNLGPKARGRIEIIGGTLVSDGVIEVTDSEGAANDYTLDRNTGQIRLESVLAEGDVLSAGTPNTRAFIESTSIPTTDITVDAESWWVVDGDAQIVSSGIAAGGTIELADYVPSGGSAWGDRVRVSGGILFTEVQAGDWAIFNDSAMDAANLGAFRVAYVDPGGTYFEIERPASPAWTAESVTLSTGGLTFVRTLEPVQRIVIPIGDNYTAGSFATEINTQIRGATAYVSRTTKLRVRTNTFGTGDIALVAQDAESALMLMSPGSAVTNLTSHLASVEAGSTETGTPEFMNTSLASVTSEIIFVRSATSPAATSGHHLAWVKPFADVDNTVAINYAAKSAGWIVAATETVTGVTSGASGTLTAASTYPAGGVLGGPAVTGDVEGTIQLTAVTGVFLEGEYLTGSTSGASIATVVSTSSTAKDRWSGSNQHSPIYNLNGTTITVRNSLERNVGDRYYAASPYAIGPNDDLTVVVDEDSQQQRYAMPMYRNVTATTATFGATNAFTDTDNSDASLAAGFGTDFDWQDYAVWMKARTKTHNEAGDTTKTVLYRFNRFGPEGNQVYLSYVYPDAASTAISVTTDSLTDGQTRVEVSIPTSAARTGVTVRNTTKVGYITAAGPGTLNTLTYILGFAITTANKVIRLKVKPPNAGGNFAAADAIDNGAGATANVVAVEYSTGVTGYGYLTIDTVVGTFADGDTITDGGAKSGTVDGSQYGLCTATLDIATPGATDSGLLSDIIAVASTTNFAANDVIYGQSSGAKAVVVTVTAPFFLSVRELSGTFSSSENVSATVFGASASTILGSGYARGNTVYVNSSSGSFSSGLKNIIGRTGSTIYYVEGTTAAAATPNIGTVSYDVGEATTTGSTAVNGDLVNVATGSDLNTAYERTIRTTTLAAQYWKGPADGTYTVSTVVTWRALNQATNLSFFPVSTGTATAADFATAVNALDDCPVTAVAMGLAGVTTGVISQASFDEFSATADKNYTMTDGINWVRTHTTPPDTSTNFSFTFKDAVTATLATNSDWDNEVVRLVPTTTKNVVDWLNAQAVSGLSSVAEAVTSQDGDRPQIASLLSGRIGSIQVQGGSANSVSAPIAGATVSVDSTYALAAVKASDAIGLSGNQWVAVQNYAPMPRQVFAAGTIIETITALGVVTLDAASTTNAWNYANTSAAHIDGVVWQIEKQGDFVSYQRSTGSLAAFAGIAEGDWVVITGTIPAVTPDEVYINSRNQGMYRVVRIDETTATFWIENPNALDELAPANLHFLDYDSIMPGDQIIISTPVLGTENQGVWTVASIDPTNFWRFTLDVSEANPVPIPGPVTLGTSSPLIQCVEGTASRMIKKIRAIAVNDDDPEYVDVKFETVAGYRQISEAAGSVIQSLDKLDFPTDLIQGVDGYRYSTGLIQEVNRIAYGDPGDPASYPGIVAAGAQVNIEGPLVKRITCSMVLRLKTGVGEKDVKVQVRSAVASVVNAADVGESISISSLIDAATSVPGVVAVTWLAPTYGAGNDLISVQPFEKPLVLDLVADILVSLVGE